MSSAERQRGSRTAARTAPGGARRHAPAAASRRRAAAALLTATTLVLPGAAHADDTHYQDFVIGGRAMALGGAFTSLANDPSGIYYNPAGIADVRDNSLQLSSSLYGFERGSLDDKIELPVPGVENLDIQFTDLIIVPASAGFVNTFGPRANDGQRRHAYGLSIVVPSFRSFSASAGETDGPSSASYQRRVTDRELWSGVGYGYKVTRRLRVGLSGYYVLRSVTDREDVTVHESLGEGQGDKFQTVANDITLLTGSLLLLGGAKYRLTDDLTLGASIQSPSVRVHSQADLQFARAGSDPTAPGGANSTFERLDLSGVRSDTAHGLCVRVGASYRQRYRFTVSVDASYHAPVSYTLVEVDPEYRGRLPFNPEVRRHGVFNVNAGIEYLVVREVSVAAGLFTDFSSAPPVPAEPTADQPAHVDLYGLTMALGYFGQHSLSRLGIVYSFGAGDDVIPRSDVDRVLHQDQAFRRVAYSQSFFYIFLSSSFRY